MKFVEKMKLQDICVACGPVDEVRYLYFRQTWGRERGSCPLAPHSILGPLPRGVEALGTRLDTQLSICTSVNTK